MPGPVYRHTVDLLGDDNRLELVGEHRMGDRRCVGDPRPPGELVLGDWMAGGCRPRLLLVGDGDGEMAENFEARWGLGVLTGTRPASAQGGGSALRPLVATDSFFLADLRFRRVPGSQSTGSTAWGAGLSATPEKWEPGAQERLERPAALSEDPTGVRSPDLDRGGGFQAGGYGPVSSRPRGPGSPDHVWERGSDRGSGHRSCGRMSLKHMVWERGGMPSSDGSSFGEDEAVARGPATACHRWVFRLAWITPVTASARPVAVGPAAAINSGKVTVCWLNMNEGRRGTHSSGMPTISRASTEANRPQAKSRRRCVECMRSVGR